MDITEQIHSGLARLDDQEEALRNPRSAYFFALYVPGADIEKCQAAACRDVEYAYRFACRIPGADIEKCQEAVCKNPMYVYLFARNIPEADINKCIEACRGTKYEGILNEYLMDKALL